MADFQKAKILTLRIEGGYSNNPADKGGETYKGISRKFNPAWAGWKIVDQFKLEPGFPKTLDNHPAMPGLIDIAYKTKYWDPLMLDYVSSQAIANEVFDTCVNMGVDVAAMFVCKAINLLNKNQKLYANINSVKRFNEKIVALINNTPDEGVLSKVLNVLQGHRYIELCDKDESQEEFFKGWIKQRISL